MPRFYYTFGTLESYPYQGGWVEVIAPNFIEAHKKFRAKFPDTTPGILNCADFYSEFDFKCTTMVDGNRGAKCHEVIEQEGLKMVEEREIIIRKIVNYLKYESRNTYLNRCSIAYLSKLVEHFLNTGKMTIDADGRVSTEKIEPCKALVHNSKNRTHEHTYASLKACAFYIKECEEAQPLFQPNKREYENCEPTFTDFSGWSNWVKGRMGDYVFDAKLFDEGSVYGINDGRVSKLSIRQMICGVAQTVVNYDRGWDIEPKTDTEKYIYEKILSFLENSPKRFE